MKRCRELMTTDLRWVPDHATALDAAQVMRENAIGFLPICEASSGRLVSVVTDRDLVTRMCAVDGMPSETSVAAIATTSPITCHEEADLVVAEEAMRRFQISRIVVVDEFSRPVGILSLNDLREGQSGRRRASSSRSVTERDVSSMQPVPAGDGLARGNVDQDGRDRKAQPSDRAGRPPREVPQS